MPRTPPFYTQIKMPENGRGIAWKAWKEGLRRKGHFEMCSTPSISRVQRNLEYFEVDRKNVFIAQYIECLELPVSSCYLHNFH